MTFVAKDAGFDARIRESFAKQGLMATLGAILRRIEPGEVEIALVSNPAIGQQHGFIHAGALAAIADSAAGYAALSLMPAGAGVLTTEFKINLVAPAAGHGVRAVGRVLKPGRTLTLVQSEIVDDDPEKRLVALLTATMMTVSGRDGIAD